MNIKHLAKTLKLKINDESITITGPDRSKYHEFGTDKIPERPFIFTRRMNKTLSKQCRELTEAFKALFDIILEEFKKDLAKVYSLFHR